MKQFVYRIKDPAGMHARPAGALATYAKRFDSELSVTLGEKQADGKRLLSLMSLGATCGAELTFTISGSDEQMAWEGLRHFCREQLRGVVLDDPSKAT